ncbi:hypothetical protein SDC9_102545 [bioreactor metagenome]|uniref:Uncharacterized protein n=1 Tax=bioreactor metagenome TaxID=1076179 RepID=A0A645ASM0_9ZZZZ
MANHLGNTGQHLAVVDFDEHIDSQRAKDIIRDLDQFQLIQ